MKKRNKWIPILMILCLSGFLFGCGKNAAEQGTTPGMTQETGATQADQSITLNLWYTAEYMQNFMDYAAQRFMDENQGVTVIPKLVSTANYLDNINSNSIKQTNVIDVYMLPSEDLEQAYLAGLAKPYSEVGTVYTEENYSNTAIKAVTYKEKRVAYPLCFDSAFLVYNHAYTDQAPKNFDELLDFANGFGVEDGNDVAAQLKQVLIWNVSDVQMNYQFLTDTFQIGGTNGDDRENITIYHADVIRGLNYFRSLNDFFAVDRTTQTNEEIVDFFVDGKAAFTITNTAGLTTLHQAGMDFGVCAMPDITAKISAGALSTTQTLVINPYTKYLDAAQRLVKAISYDYADEFYVKTGYFPSRYNWNYDSAMVEGVYDNYADSTPRTKIMNVGDLYMKLEIMLHQIWDDGDIEESLMEFQQYVKEQLKE